MNIAESFKSLMVKTGMIERVPVQTDPLEVAYLHESLDRLRIELENLGWRQIGDSQTTGSIFDRHTLGVLIEEALAMAIKNPTTNRAINVQADYVFGRGVRFIAKHPIVQEVVDEFTSYDQNQKVLFSHSAMSRQEKELLVKGNLFFVLFTNRRTGRVIVRDLDMNEVQDIIRDPNDYHQEWFIKRCWTDSNNKERISYYPALGITRDTPGIYLPKDSDPGSIQWDAPCYHMSFNRFGRMKFAVPEILPMLAWARAHTVFLERWSSIMGVLARIAMKVVGMGGKKQAAAAKGQLNTSVSTSNPREGNPSPTTASLALLGKGVDVEPIKTAGSTTPASEGQPLLNMAAAGSGLPNTFFGDSSIGTHATASTLDRPTELKMRARQKLWEMGFGTIINYATEQSGLAFQGILREAGAEPIETVDPFNDNRKMIVQMPINTDIATGPVDKPISLSVEVKFPELLERNVTDRVRALVNALTLFGKPLMDIVPDKRLVCRLLLEALNVDGIDELIPQFVVMWEKNLGNEDGLPTDAIIVPPPPPASGPAAGGAVDPAQGGDVGANG